MVCVCVCVRACDFFSASPHKHAGCGEKKGRKLLVLSNFRADMLVVVTRLLALHGSNIVGLQTTDLQSEG